ncbi:MAG TPA: hypothetical protein VGB52_15390 [Actinomycetota bacterium]
MRRSRLGPLVALLGLIASVVSIGPTVAEHAGHPYLVVWTGDWNAGDYAGADAADPAGVLGRLSGGPPGPDFLAVIDADASSPRYGEIIQTVTVPGIVNEPHHMQYSWRPGDRVFAGGLFSDTTFVFDVDRIPLVELVGMVGPADTPCGSVPDAYWVLGDGTAFGTYMGGPNVPGDPRCNGGINNGFAGTPGSLVRIGRDGSVLGEFSAAGDPARPHPNDAGRPQRCVSNPPLARASCANPHGIQAREDLGLMITSDYAEPRNVPIDPASAPDPNVFRDTVRVWDIRNLNAPRLHSVSVMPVGSMAFLPPDRVDARGVMGIMETTVTNMPEHRGAFASSMCGGQIYYTADITSQNPMWRQVFDATAAARALNSGVERVDGCVGAGWLQTSPDDSLLFQAVIGRSPGTLDQNDPGVPKMVYALDISELVDVPVAEWTVDNLAVCTIDTEQEVSGGGDEPGCPAVAGAVDLGDPSTGGPHWGTIDLFSLSEEPDRISGVTRIAVSNYFVARAGLDGDHRVCMVDVAADGSLSIDGGFVDERTGEPCTDFDRPDWPHGTFGPGKPHSMLFVISTQG